MGTMWAVTMLDWTSGLIWRCLPVFVFCGLASFAEYAVVQKESCVAVRRDVPLAVSALVGCAVATGVGAAGVARAWVAQMARAARAELCTVARKALRAAARRVLSCSRGLPCRGAAGLVVRGSPMGVALSVGLGGGRCGVFAELGSADGHRREHESGLRA